MFIIPYLKEEEELKLREEKGFAQSYKPRVKLEMESKASECIAISCVDVPRKANP